MEKANFENLLRIALGLFMKTIFSEIHKPLNHISPPIMQEFFDLKVTPYNLRNNNLLRLPKTNASRDGIKRLCFKGSIIWNTVPG